MDAGPGAGGAVRAVHSDVDESEPALHPSRERGNKLEAVAPEKGRRKCCGLHGGPIRGVFCTATCGIFSSNPRRTHSGKKDKEKEEYGLL